MIKSIRFSGLIFFLIANYASAQEMAEPKKVFKKNYANETFGKKAPKVSDSGKESSGALSVTEKNPEKEMGFIDSDTSVKERPEEPEDTSYENLQGTKVVWLGAIIQGNNESSTDVTHHIEKLAELTEQANKHDLMIGPVFLIGKVNMPAIVPFLKTLQYRQALIEYVNQIPAKYSKVKMSPAWIVQTEKGQVILEATGPLRRHFNKNGELVVMSHH